MKLLKRTIINMDEPKMAELSNGKFEKKKKTIIFDNKGKRMCNVHKWTM